MKHHTVTVTRASTAPPEQVWALLADAATWPDWSPVRVMTVERTDADGGAGVGAIRRLKTSLATSREEVLEAEAPHRFRYRLLSGLPLTDYEGLVTVAAVDGGGSEVRWTSTFDSPGGPLGWFWGRFIGAAIASYCTGLARHAATLVPHG